MKLSGYQIERKQKQMEDSETYQIELGEVAWWVAEQAWQAEPYPEQAPELSWVSQACAAAQPQEDWDLRYHRLPIDQKGSWLPLSSVIGENCINTLGLGT